MLLDEFLPLKVVNHQNFPDRKINLHKERFANSNRESDSTV